MSTFPCIPCSQCIISSAESLSLCDRLFFYIEIVYVFKFLSFVEFVSFVLEKWIGFSTPSLWNNFFRYRNNVYYWFSSFRKFISRCKIHECLLYPSLLEHCFLFIKISEFLVPLSYRFLDFFIGLLDYFIYIFLKFTHSSVSGGECTLLGSTVCIILVSECSTLTRRPNLMYTMAESDWLLQLKCTLLWVYRAPGFLQHFDTMHTCYTLVASQGPVFGSCDFLRMYMCTFALIFLQLNIHQDPFEIIAVFYSLKKCSRLGWEAKSIFSFLPISVIFRNFRLWFRIWHFMNGYSTRMYFV